MYACMRIVPANRNIKAINRLIEELADKHKITFKKASMLVHLGGHIFKDR
jgi:hypothetical protein